VESELSDNGGSTHMVDPGSLRYLQEMSDKATRSQPSFSAMSSAQRSASMDNIVRQVEALTEAQKVLQRDFDNVRGVAENASVRSIETYDFLRSLNHGTLWQRLRWLVTGK
jgi:hypothetical protein